jgi:hypothetical protein
MRKFLYLLLTAAGLAVLALAADVNVRIISTGADVSPARAKSQDRVVWTGNQWSVEFPGNSPCQNGKKTFSSTETGQNRICTISVTCTTANRSGCGRYKYNSRADGGPVVDPEIEVEP